MIKTIKVKKKLRLDELIKYVIDKDLNSYQFTSDNNVDVYFSSNGYFLIAGDGSGDGGSRSFELADTFTVEVEEEFDYDTVIDYAIDEYDDEANVQELMQQRSDMNKAVNEWYAKAKAFDRIVKESKGTFSCGDFCDDVRHIINNYEIEVNKRNKKS